MRTESPCSGVRASPSGSTSGSRWRSRRWRPSASTAWNGRSPCGSGSRACLVAVLVVGSVPILLYVYAPFLTDPGRWNLPYHFDHNRWLGRELTLAAVRTALVGAAGAAAVLTAVRTRSPRLRKLACGALPLVVIADLLGAALGRRADDHAAILDRPPAQRTRAQGRPDVRPARVRPDVPERAVGGRAGLRLRADRLPPRPRHARAGACRRSGASRSMAGETPLLPRRMVEYTDLAWLGLVSYDVASVSHLLTHRRNPLSLGTPTPAGTALIYRNPGALPRARVMGHPYYAEGEAAAIRAIERLGTTIRDRVVVEDPDRPLSPDAGATGAARIVRDEPEHVVIVVDASAPAYLILADSFDPGWTATVDGNAAPIRPAWLTFRAVFVPAGRHTVDFRYRPAGFEIGLAIQPGGRGRRRGPDCSGPAGSRRRRPRTSRSRGRRVGRCGALLVLAGIIAVSAVGLDRSGRVGWNSRWSGGIHQFTWGAGYDAIRPRPQK